MRVVKVLEEFDGVSTATGKPQRRRVVILQRDDGLFSFAEEYFYVSEWEGKVVAQGWRRLGSARTSIFASAEMAEAEGRSSFAAYVLQPGAQTPTNVEWNNRANNLGWYYAATLISFGSNGRALKH